MITEREFENLIESPESSILDFKAKMYEFNDDADLKNTAKLVKDIISFSNTIRNQASFIIIGIEEASNGEKNFHGLNDNIDDAIIQDKIKDKVFPRPHFSYYSLIYKAKKFGILEFPIKKYPFPIYPTIKMKGLEIGKAYYRQGTTNTEALSFQVIQINQWFQGLTDFTDSPESTDSIGSFIKRLSGTNENLSSVISDLYNVAKEHKWQELLEFCSIEIQGFNKTSVEPNEFHYRTQKILISLDKFQVNPFANTTPYAFKEELEKSKSTFEIKLVFNQPVREIEEYIDRLNSNPKSLCSTIKMDSSRLLPESKGESYPVCGFIFKDTWLNLYRNIRQEAIDNLMKL